MAAMKAKTLDLHKPLTSQQVLRLGHELAKRRKMLFCSIFGLDQSLALTFGRRPVFSVVDREVVTTSLNAWEGHRPHLSEDVIERMLSKIRISDVDAIVSIADDNAGHMRFVLRFGETHAQMCQKLSFLQAELPSSVQTGNSYLRQKSEQNVSSGLENWLQHARKVSFELKIISDFDEEQGPLAQPIIFLFYYQTFSLLPAPACPKL